MSDYELVNSNYRSYQPLSALVRRGGGHELANRPEAGPPAPQALLSADVVHVHRLATPDMQAMARRLREHGVGVVWDDDDDLAALPRSNPQYRRIGPAGRRRIVDGVREMVRVADVITTPSPVLAEKFRKLGGADVRVLENRLPAASVGVSRPRHHGVVIACLASLEHHVDYEQLRLGEILQRLLDAHADMRVVSLGLRLGLHSDRYESLKRIPFPQLTRALAQADVGLAPLVDIPWNRARSNVKLKEYAAAGLAWLASPVGPYLGMGEREGGRLVPDDGWHDAIERLVLDARERRKLAKRAAKWVKDETIDKHATDWELALRDAAVRAGAAAGRRGAAVA